MNLEPDIERLKICQICQQKFEDFRNGLHRHVSKSHDIPVREYYQKFYPRHDLYSNDAIEYGNFEEYWNRDFIDKRNMYLWLEKTPAENAKHWMLNRLKQRMDEKKLKFAPSQVELKTSDLIPNGVNYHQSFGNYSTVCEQLGVEPLLKDETSLPDIKVDPNALIIVDTREQQPLEFPNVRKQALAFGDYSLEGKNYNYTLVDRKSEEDFKSTMSQGYERFCREIEKAISMDCYVYVVVESGIKKIEVNNKFCPHKANLKFVFHNMREIMQKYPRQTQFVFAGSREGSKKIIPYLLAYGSEFWMRDVQLMMDLNKKNVDNRQTTEDKM